MCGCASVKCLCVVVSTSHPCAVVCGLFVRLCIRVRLCHVLVRLCISLWGCVRCPCAVVCLCKGCLCAVVPLLVLVSVSHPCAVVSHLCAVVHIPMGACHLSQCGCLSVCGCVSACPVSVLSIHATVVRGLSACSCAHACGCVSHPCTLVSGACVRLCIGVGVVFPSTVVPLHVKYACAVVCLCAVVCGCVRSLCSCVSPVVPHACPCTLHTGVTHIAHLYAPPVRARMRHVSHALCVCNRCSGFCASCGGVCAGVVCVCHLHAHRWVCVTPVRVLSPPPPALWGVPLPPVTR